MKSLIRNYIIDTSSLWATTVILPGLAYDGSLNTLLVAGIAVMLINFLVVPLLKIMFLPLNLLTFGFFTWIINVLALYVLTKVVPQFMLLPYSYPGWSANGFTIPAVNLNTLQVAIVASLLLGIIANFVKWVIK